MDESGAGAARAEAALAFGAEIARGGYYSKALFAGDGTTSVRLPDPVRPVTHLLATRFLASAAGGRFVEQLFSAAPGAVSIVFEFADYAGFEPVPVEWSDISRERLFNHRTMAVRVATYHGAARQGTSQWFDLPHALPWPYLRDLLIPFEVTRRGETGPGFVQPFHAAMFAPLQHWLNQAFAPLSPGFTAFAADAGSGSLHSNHQDHGGGLVAVTPSVAIVGSGMSRPFKDALRRWGIDLVEAETPTETEHVDELFAVLPHAGAQCGRALIVLSPDPGDGSETTAATAEAIRRTTRSVHAALRRQPGLADIPCLELPVRIAGRHTADFNPVNMLSLPADDGVVCLLARPNVASLETDYRAALQRIGESLGCRIDTRFVDLRGVAPDHKGSLHCATVELRGG